MAWEQRGSRTYYYLKKREGARVRSLYVGRGDLAQSCAETADYAREEEKQMRANKLQVRENEAQIDRQLKAAEAEIFKQVSEAFRAAGYHEHKGQWRKKRHG